MAISTAMIVAMIATWNDNSKRSRISSITGRSVHIELPKFSVATPIIQSANCVASGLSRPMRVRSASISLLRRRCRRRRAVLISTTSPGTTRSMKKTSTATPSSVGIVRSTRLMV